LIKNLGTVLRTPSLLPVSCQVDVPRGEKSRPGQGKENQKWKGKHEGSVFPGIDEGAD